MKNWSSTVGMFAAFILLARAGAAPVTVKLSQYETAQYCALAAGKDGSLHAVFNEQPARDKPAYLYCRASADDGRTWSAPVNLSDDESGNSAGCGQLLFDLQGRLYAVWKYVARDTLLDGPGGRAPGRLVFRCLTGGTWSKRVAIGDTRAPAFSWFASADPKGAVHVVWSQIAPDAAEALGWSTSDYADLVRQATLDGATIASEKDLITPKPLLTKQEQDRLKAAGKYPKYEDTRPKKEGLIDLRGFVDAQGVAHFVGEFPGITDGPSSAQTGRQIVLWDGAKLVAVYSYQKYQTYNTFNDPPALLLDATGKQHLLRAPEKSEKPCVRDYPVDGTGLGDPTTVLAPKGGPGKLLNWQAHQLPGGRMAVTAALSEKGGYDPDDIQLLISYFDGANQWSEPLPVRISRETKQSFGKETVGGNAIGALYQYKPRFAAVALDKAGKPCVLAVNNEDTIVGVSGPALTGSGRLVTATGGLRTDNPSVYFVKP